MRALFFLPLVSAQLYASIEFHNASPQVILSSLDFLQSSLACPLQLQPANVSLQNIYFINGSLERLSFNKPLPLPAANCSALPVSLNPPATGGRVLIGYDIPQTDYIYSFGVLSFNVLISGDPTIKAYGIYVGSNYIVSAAPNQLMHWPTPYSTSLPVSSGRRLLLCARLKFLAFLVIGFLFMWKN